MYRPLVANPIPESRQNTFGGEFTFLSLLQRLRFYKLRRFDCLLWAAPNFPRPKVVDSKNFYWPHEDMKRLVGLCFLAASVFSSQSSAQEVIPVETTDSVNLSVPQQPLAQAERPPKSTADPFQPKLPSLWIPGGILIAGIGTLTIGVITLLADNEDANIFAGATLIGLGMGVIIASAFVGTAFSVRRKAIKELFGSGVRLSGNGFSVSF